MFLGVEVWKIVLCLVVGYAFGCIQTGHFYTKAHGVDIRSTGSGNVGMTNVMRTMGRKSGLIVFFGDFLKTVVPMVLFRYLIFKDDPAVFALTLLVGLGVVLGHNYPFYLKFKGGKGIAATCGIVLATDWRFFIVGVCMFLVIFLITRYISLFSLILVAVFPIWILIFYFGDWFALLITIIIGAMAWWRHRENIKRLINGTENKLGGKKKKAEESAE